MLAGLALMLAGALPAAAGPVDERAGRTRRGPELTFGRPVALSSFAPLRTAIGTVYSADQTEHEWSGEPSIQVDDAGVIYIAGTCCVGPAAPVWRSTDDGRTFAELETPGHVREWGIGAEGDLAYDGDGTVLFVDTYVPGIMVTRWRERGDVWDFTRPAAGVIPGIDDRPWLAYGAGSYYLYVNHVSHTDVYRSDDEGQSWLSTGPLTWQGSPLGQPYFPGHVAAGRKDGSLWVAGLVGDKTTLGAAVSTDGGASWSDAAVTTLAADEEFSPIFTGIVAVDDAGTGYVTWSVSDRHGCDVFYAASTDHGRSWNEPVRVSDGRGCATFPWITAGKKGRIALVWYETDFERSEDPAAVALRALSAGTTIYNGLRIPIAYQDELPADAEWFVHAAAVTGAASKRPAVSAARVPTPTPVLEGPLGRALWDFFQVSIGPDGRLHIAYVTKYRDNAPATWYVGSRAGPRLR